MVNGEMYTCCMDWYKVAKQVQNRREWRREKQISGTWRARGGIQLEGDKE